jgi:signal transduction histidine kinase
LKRIYKDESKIINVAENIGEKVKEIEKYLSEIISASNDDFMNLSVDCRDIYSSDVWGQVIDYYNPKMELNNITFEKEIKGNTLIKADGDRLVEVLQNIIENAIKYGDGRYIGMSACREEEEYLIAVENTGCELTDAEAVHIFDSFYRGSNVGNQPGSGLGLYICRKLIHAMEGEIFAEIKEDADGRKMCIKIVMRLA